MNGRGTTDRHVRQASACRRRFRIVLVAAAVMSVGAGSRWRVHADPVPVRFAEGVSRGFLRLRAANGTALADGELSQRQAGPQVTSRLTFRFRDGSLYDETTVFLQQQHFRLVTEHVVQRGPAFPQALDMFIDAKSGNVTVRYADGDEQKVESAHFDLPADLANGLIVTLLKNARRGAPPKSFPYVAAAPKPRIVKLVIAAASGRERFVTGDLAVVATHYVVKVDLGPITGALASVAGKQPPDSHVWIVDGEAPTFVAAEQPFFSGGPLWRIELAALERPRRAR
jgi:hypothetical protein